MNTSVKEELDELTKPVKAIEEKWKLLPHFLRMRGLMRQHIDSFDDFINVEIKNIVAARSNFEVRSEADPKFFLRYTDIYVGEPNVEEESFVTSNGEWPAVAVAVLQARSSEWLPCMHSCHVCLLLAGVVHSRLILCGASSSSLLLLLLLQ